MRASKEEQMRDKIFTRVKIFEEIEKERDYQDKKWGTEFDDKSTLNDWVSFITQYIGKAMNFGNTQEDQRKHMLKAASLCVAALEAFDRNGEFPSRHYD